MAGFFKKIFSGLDFWDTEENRQQRQQYAQQDDEEERKRKAQQAAQTQARSQQPGTVVQPDIPGITKPPVKAGSLSDLQQPGNQFSFNQPLQKAQAPQPQPPKPVAPPAPKPVQPPVDPNEVRQRALAYAKPKVQDVNNYYGSDAKLLQDELNKGDQADINRVQGLMQSLDNRTKELQDFHNARGENQSFKTARELGDTIKNTRGDWTKQNDQLKKFWDDVAANEGQDFEQYRREKGLTPEDLKDPMMIRAAGMWKNGNGMNFTPDFTKDNEDVKSVQSRQHIADAALKYGGVGLDQMGGTTILTELNKFKDASPEEQRGQLKDLEDIIGTNSDNYSASPELKRKAEQAFLIYNTLLDSGAQKDNFHTKFNKLTDTASRFGGALLESPKHVVQSADVLLNQEILGKGDTADQLEKDWHAGKISDEEYNKAMNEYAKSLEWLPKDDSIKSRLLTAAGTSADTVATFLPILGAAKGIKGSMVLEKMIQEGVAGGLSREAASTAAKETLALAVKEGGETSLKKLAAQEAVANALFSGVGSLRTGEFDPAQTLKETVTGAAIGGTAPVVGSKVGAWWQKLRGANTALPEAAEDVGRVTSRIETGTADNLARGAAINSETASRMSEIQQTLDDPSIPSYQKLPLKQELEQLQNKAADDVARSMGVADDALDKPAYAHKQDIQSVIDDEEAKLNQVVNDNPGITDEELQAASDTAKARVLQRIQALNDARYGATSVSVDANIPDVNNPIALAKADQAAAAASVPAANEAPIANFNRAVDVPLQKAEPVVPAKAEAAAPATTAEGNAPLVSDAEAARQMQEAGLIPARGASPVAATEDQLQQAADEAARTQVTSEGAAPRTREQAANLLSDETLRADIMDNFPEKQTVNLAETENAAKTRINNMTDEQLVASFSQPIRVESPENYLTAVNSIRRLEGIGTPEAKQAIQNAIDGLAEYTSKSGQGLRVTQMLFEDMPTTMKADYLVKKIGNAGVEMTDADRGMLLNLIERSDEATTNLNKLRDEAQGIIDSGAINNRSLSPETRTRVKELSSQIQQAIRDKELKSGEAWKFYQDQIPKGPMGKRVADIGRTMMLSSPSGRAFDVISTTATTADDLLTGGVSNLLGKVLNKAPGQAGKFSDTVIAPRKLVKGFREGLRRVGSSLKGNEGVEDFMTEARKSTRGDISRGGPIRRTVRAFVEAPTEMTRGLQDQELFRQGMQEASQQGLKGSARRAYAELRAVVPTEEQLQQGVEAHMKANMLHNNKISRFLNGIAQSLDKGGHGWGAVFIRNQVAPFTSWVGGNLHRTLTDKNVLFNAFKIAQSATRSDAQGVINNLAKLGVNSGEAYAAGMLLTKAGVITTQDANGDSYGGLYFHIGDRYIPVAIAGTMAVPLIWGNSLQQAMDASGKGESPMAAFGNSLLTNTLKNTGVQSVFGGDNTFQSTISSLVDDKGAPSDAIAQYVGDFTRQYIPGLMSDVNALLDSNKSLNPTGEAALTKVTEENPATGRDKTNVGKTEWNKTLNKIPFASQNLPRDEGKPARDILDRVVKGNHETGQMVEERKAAETKKQRDERRKKDDVPDDETGIKARTEEGEYGAAIAGWKQQLENYDEKGKDIPPSKRKDAEDEIKRLQLTMDNNYSPEVVKLYNDVSLSEWRNMIDPDSEDYDPETAGKLQAYDKLLTGAGVGRGKAPDKPKYSEKKAGSGGRGGKSGPKFLTDIATTKFSDGGFSPQKARSASNAAPKSAIPVLEKVPNYDRSKLKKITVKKGPR